MISKDFLEVIKIISKRLKKSKIQWALIGSTNMAIQGIDVTPRDLDLVVKLSDLSKMNSIFFDYNPGEIRELKPLSEKPALDIKIIIDNIEVQILGEKDSGEYVKKLLLNQIILIRLNNIEIPCLTLKAEARTYSETKRQHKADLINNFLEKERV